MITLNHSGLGIDSEKTFPQWQPDGKLQLPVFPANGGPLESVATLDFDVSPPAVHTLAKSALLDPPGWRLLWGVPLQWLGIHYPSEQPSHALASADRKALVLDVEEATANEDYMAPPPTRTILYEPLTREVFKLPGLEQFGLENLLSSDSNDYSVYVAPPK